MLRDLRNLGPVSEKMLFQAGIETEAQLKEMGSVAAYCAVVRCAMSKPSLNLLWAIEGALTERDWKEIAHSERTSLLIAVDDFEKRYLK